MAAKTQTAAPALQSAKVLQARIDKFGVTVNGVQQEAHDIGLQVMRHYDEHGDYTLLARFVGAKIGHKPKGAKKFVITDDFPGVCGTLRKNIVAWFVRFTDIRFRDDGMLYRMNRKSATFAAHVEQNDGKAVNVEAAAANPWWTLDGAKRDSSRNAIDLLNLISIAESISKRINTAIEADAERTGDDDGHAYVPEQLDQMKAFADMIEKATQSFIKKNDVNVVNLQAERVLRKASAGQAQADVDRPVTTGSVVESAGGTETIVTTDPTGAGKAGDPIPEAA